MGLLEILVGVMRGSEVKEGDTHLFQEALDGINIVLTRDLLLQIGYNEELRPRLLEIYAALNFAYVNRASDKQKADEHFINLTKRLREEEKIPDYVRRALPVD